MELLLSKIRDLAAPWPVELFSRAGHQLLRVSFQDGLYYEAVPEDLFARLTDGLLAEVQALVQWVHARGFRFEPAKWVGSEASYRYIEEDGRRTGPLNIKSRGVLPISRHRDSPKLQALSYQANVLGLSMLSTEWQGLNFRYTFVDGDENYIGLTPGELYAYSTNNEKLNQLDKKSKKLGLSLQTKEWRGDDAVYDFINADGVKVMLPVNSLEAYHDAYQALHSTAYDKYVELKALALSKALALKSDKWVSGSSIYEFVDLDGAALRLTPAQVKAMPSPEERLALLAKKAKKQGLILQSDNWLGFNAEYEFVDRDRNAIRLTGYNVRDYTSINRAETGPIIIKTKDKNLENLSRLALERSLTLTSKTWLGHRANYNFVDSSGHVLRFTPAELRATSLAQVQLALLSTKAKKMSLSLKSKRWKGKAALYAFTDSCGRLIMLTATYVFSIKDNCNIREYDYAYRAANVGLNHLSRIASEKSLILKTSIWLGHQFKYEFIDEDGAIVKLTHAELRDYITPNAQRERHKEKYVELLEISKKFGLRLVSLDWFGNDCLYDFYTKNGFLVRLTYNLNILRLASIADKKLLRLMSAQWLGTKYSYEFETMTGHVVKLDPAGLRKRKSESEKLKYLSEQGSSIEPGYNLVIETFHGNKGQYDWISSDGRVITASLKELKKKSLQIFFKPIKPFVTLDIRVTQAFSWKLPDKTTVTATWPEFHTAMERVTTDFPVRVGEDGIKYAKAGFSEKIKQVLSNSSA